MNKKSFLVRARTSIRNLFSHKIRRHYYNYIWGMDIGEGCIISYKANLDKTNPRGVHMGKYSTIAFGSAIVTHDFVRGLYADTWIGERCYIGAHSIILAGVRVGDGCVIAAGSVVMKDIPSGCLVYGNPARVIERGIVTGPYGKLIKRGSKSVTGQQAAKPADEQV